MTRFTHNPRGVAALLLILVFAGMLFAPLQNAQASVPTHCTPFLDINCIKEVALDPLATALGKTIIRAVRDATIRWIKTGDFEIKKPFFTTSFITDPQRIADNAARLFLSELTGINFCNFHPSIPSIQRLGLNVDLNLTLSCSPNLGQSGEIRDEGIGGTLATLRPSQNFSTVVRTLRDAQSAAVHRAVSSFADEVRANSGFLGQRDSATGKIKTPGRLIADSIPLGDLSEQIGVELVDELDEAIVKIIDTAFGTLVKKGLNL